LHGHNDPFSTGDYSKKGAPEEEIKRNNLKNIYSGSFFERNRDATCPFSTTSTQVNPG